MANDKLKSLRKKIFLLAGYLLVTGVLFAYVSYSQYRITITGSVMMPQTYTMNASIDITNTTGAAASLSSTEAAIMSEVELEGMLSAVAPGSDAETFASAGDLSEPHYFILKIKNSEIVSGSSITSPLSMDYDMWLESEGILPLEFCFVDDATNTTYSALTYRTLTHSAVQFKDGLGNAFKGHLTGSAIDASAPDENEYKVYVGWNNTVTSQSIALSKELDKIKIKTNMTALSGPSGAGTTAPTVEMDKVYIPTESAIEGGVSE